MVFTNGRQMLYMGTNVRDEHGAIHYAVATIRDVTDLNEARKKVEELQKLTTLYQAQLRTLHTQGLGRDIVYQGEIMRKVWERTLRLARLSRAGCETDRRRLPEVAVQSGGAGEGPL